MDDSVEKALADWMQAEADYREESAHYISSGILESGKPVPSPERALDREALDRLTSMLDRIAETQRAYREVSSRAQE